MSFQCRARLLVTFVRFGAFLIWMQLFGSAIIYWFKKVNDYIKVSKLVFDNMYISCRLSA